MKIRISKKNLSSGLDKLEGRCQNVEKWISKRNGRGYVAHLFIGTKNENNYLLLELWRKY